MKNDFIKSPSKISLYALSCMVFLISDTQGGVGPFISVYLKSVLDWDTGKIGMVLATYNIASLIAQIPSGYLIDVIKFKRSLVAICSLVVSLGCLLIVNSVTLAPILIAQAFIGVATSVIPPAIAAITLGLVGRKMFPERLAINATFNHAGNVINALITGLMAFWLGVTWILYVDFIFGLASIIPIFLINKFEIDNEIARESPEEKDLKNIEPEPIKKLLTTPVIILFGISVALFTFSNAAQLPLVGQKLANINPKVGATYMASSIILAQLVMIGVAFLLSFFIDKIGRKPLFITSYLILIIRAIFYTLTDKPFLLLANQLLDGMAAGIFSIVSIVIISDIAGDTGRFNFTQGLMIFCISIGAALSNLVAGYVSKLFGIEMGFMLLAFIAFIGVLFYGFLMPETKNKNFFMVNKAVYNPRS